MQILLADAKLMCTKSDVKPWTIPSFQPEAEKIAIDMAQLDVDSLSKFFNCSRNIAMESKNSYANYFFAEKMPAILAYQGQAYKHLLAKSLSSQQLTFGQKHLWITSFLYGLLRPMDGIVPYRMEHAVALRTTDDKPISQFWRNKLTDVLINSVQSDDNILIHLSTTEYEHLFDWRRVQNELKVIQPLFYVRDKDGKLKMQAVWAKSCRGAMVKHILGQQICSLDKLKAFSYKGFEYRPDLGEEKYPHFVKE